MKHITLRSGESALGLMISQARSKTTYSQDDLSSKLGYKTGQFVSNIERGKCSLPTNKIPLVADLLSIDEGRLIDAILSDRKKRIKITCEIIRENTKGSKADEYFMGGTRGDSK